MHAKFIPPAQLWVGKQQRLQEEVIRYVQEQFCSAAACGSCAICRRIAARQHERMVWLVPEKNAYTKADFEVIVQTTSFALEADEHHFFIITLADLMTPAVANSLLKIIEEPPRGYHTIFCTERPGMLLPTIVSRCVVTTFDLSDQQTMVPQLLHFFKEPDAMQLTAFSKYFESAPITEQMTPVILDELLNYWRAVLAERDQGKDLSVDAEHVIEYLLKAYQQLPMPGGAKLFWRNLFLKMVMIQGEGS